MTGSASGATLNIDKFKVKTTAWRVVASKSLIMFGLAAGVGQDKYRAIGDDLGDCQQRRGVSERPAVRLQFRAMCRT